MKKSIKLNSQEWCDIVFNGKNKSYGAYEMRMSSSKRHIVAFLCMLMLPIAVILLSLIVNKVQASNSEYGDNIQVDIVMSQLKPDEPIEDIVDLTVPEPPKPLPLNSIEFVPPVIGEDADVPDDLEVNTMDDVIHDTRVVGYMNVDTGTDDLSAELAQVAEEVRIITEEPVVMEFAEVMPQFPGGQTEMLKYVGDNLRYPVVDQENGTQGRVTVRFVVTKTGEIDQVQVVRGVSPTCDKEAIRVVKSMPRWIPGKQNGKPVAVYFTLPVLYRLK